MLIFFLTSLLTLNSFLNNQTNFVLPENQAISFNEIKNYPASLGIDLTAKSALVVDLDSGKALLAKNSTELRPIASLTKLITALVLTENNPDWNKEVEYSLDDNIESLNQEKEQEKKSPEPSQINFLAGEKIKLEDLFTAALVKSANNAIKTLVRQSNFCCGKNFVGQMNETAQRLGMKSTIFIEPTGLNSGDLSTAEDLVKLIQVIKDNEIIKRALNHSIYSFKTDRRTIQVKSTNKLLDSFIKVELGKTGYTEEAGYCFAGITSYQNKKLVVIVLGSQSENDRLAEVKGLTVWASELSK